MKMFIYGAGNIGKQVVEILEKYYPHQLENVKGFIDKNKTIPVKEIPIVPIENVKPDARIVIAIQSRDTAIDVFLELQKRGYSNIWWFTERWQKYGLDFLREMCVSCKGWKKPILPQVEMHIMDSCNLNCRGCAHFSPIFENNIPDFSSRIADVEAFARKFGHIFRFAILGGEPFMNKEISRYAEKIREILPDSTIEIITNGILIPNVPDETFEVIRKNDICISISEYAPTHKIIDGIVKRLEKFGILYDIRGYSGKRKFNIPLSLIKDSKYEKRCISNGCVTIWNGKMARCPTLMYIDQFNQKFDQNLPNDGVMMLDEELTGEELILRFSEKVPLCDYCVWNEIDWDVCGRPVKLDDFAVGD